MTLFFVLHLSLFLRFSVTIILSTLYETGIKFFFSDKLIVADYLGAGSSINCLLKSSSGDFSTFFAPVTINSLSTCLLFLIFFLFWFSSMFFSFSSTYFQQKPAGFGKFLVVKKLKVLETVALIDFSKISRLSFIKSVDLSLILKNMNAELDSISTKNQKNSILFSIMGSWGKNHSKSASKSKSLVKKILREKYIKYEIKSWCFDQKKK